VLQRVARLRQIPTIILDYPHAQSPLEPTVQFTTAIYGIHLTGTAYRMDEIPIVLKKVLDSDYPPDDLVLSEINAAAAGT
jgi:formylmethanofuran dehydrogenase subunit B